MYPRSILWKCIRLSTTYLTPYIRRCISPVRLWRSTTISGRCVTLSVDCEDVVDKVLASQTDVHHMAVHIRISAEIPSVPPDHGIYFAFHVCSCHQEQEGLGRGYTGRNQHDRFLESRHCLAQGHYLFSILRPSLTKLSRSCWYLGDFSAFGRCWIISIRQRTWCVVWRTTILRLAFGEVGTAVTTCGSSGEAFVPWVTLSLYLTRVLFQDIFTYPWGDRRAWFWIAFSSLHS